MKLAPKIGHLAARTNGCIIQAHSECWVAVARLKYNFSGRSPAPTLFKGKILVRTVSLPSTISKQMAHWIGEPGGTEKTQSLHRNSHRIFVSMIHPIERLRCQCVFVDMKGQCPGVLASIGMPSWRRLMWK